MPVGRQVTLFAAALLVTLATQAVLTPASAAGATTAMEPAQDASAGKRAFDPSVDRWALDLVDATDRDALKEALTDAGSNWSELAVALRSLEGEKRDACLWLVKGMPHLDRLEMRASTLTEHVEYAYRAREELPYAVPDEMFEPYILTYRVGEEPVSPWRAELHDRFSPLADSQRTVEGTARAINDELAAAMKEDDRQFFGALQSPLLTLKSGRGTGAEIAILASAALKSVGIPSRQASVAALGEESRGASWIEFYDGSRWLPLFPLEPEALGDFGHVEREHPRNVTVVSSSSSFERVLVTENYTETGSVEFSFVEDGAPAAEFEHFSLSVLNDGSLVPLDALDAVADIDGRFTAVVGEGRYVALAGVRNSDGEPFVMMRDVNVVPGERIVVAFDVSPRGETRRPRPRELRDLKAAVTVVFLLKSHDEPSTRMLPLVSSEVARYSGAVRLVCAYRGSEDVPDVAGLAGPEAEVSPVPSDRDAFEDRSGVSSAFPDDTDGFPTIHAYVTSSGDEVLSHEGYDLNIARRLGEALDAALAGMVD